MKMAEQHKINIPVYQLFVETISKSNNIEVMAKKLGNLLVAALGIKGAAIFVLNPELEALELLASTGLSIDYVNKGPILVDKSIALPPNREPVIISDTDKSDKLQYPEKAEQEGVRAIVSHPIIMRGKIIGSLRLYHSDPWEISADDMGFVAALSQTIGLALMYFRVANAVANVKETVNDIHPVWL
jgi:GAF domain-containing protein